MRRFAVAAVLLACLVGACSAQSSLPRPRTGAPSCVLPITRVTCFVDATSGYVSGFRYGYTNQAGVTRVCAAATGSVVARGNTTASAPVDGTIAAADNRGDTILNYALPIPAGQGIRAVEVKSLPGVRARMRIPAINFYLANLATGEFTEYVTCGRVDLERGGALQTSATFLNPVEETGRDPGSDEPIRFLSSFQGKCAYRNLINSPNDPTFYLQAIQKPCWAPNAVAPVPPKP